MALVLWGFLSEMFNTGIERTTTLTAVAQIHQQLNNQEVTPCALNIGTLLFHSKSDRLKERPYGK